jgi:competence protein ComEA
MEKKFVSRMLALLCVSAFIVTFSFSPVLAAEKININTATETELQTLKHIGKVKAQRIVEYRKQHPFQNVEEIKKIQGIGEKSFEYLKDKITVE